MQKDEYNLIDASFGFAKNYYELIKIYLLDEATEELRNIYLKYTNLRRFRPDFNNKRIKFIDYTY